MRGDGWKENGRNWFIRNMGGGDLERGMKDFEWKFMVLVIANGSESKGKCQLDEYSEDGVYQECVQGQRGFETVTECCQFCELFGQVFGERTSDE